MPKIIVIIDGPDSGKAVTELVSNAEYDNLEVAIWSVDVPEDAHIESSTLIFIPTEKDEVIN